MERSGAGLSHAGALAEVHRLGLVGNALWQNPCYRVADPNR